MEEKESPKAPPLPKPPIVLRGTGGLIPPKPKPTQALTDFPQHFPNHLKPRTSVIIGEALKRFPDQTQTLQLCKQVISELTPHFCTAAHNNTLRADLALSAMSDLLHYLLVANCDDSSKRFDLEREIKKSDEWVKLAQGLIEPAEAQAKIEAARKLISQADQLSASEKEDFGNAVADLAKESPRTAVAVEKFKKYSAKAGKAIGDGVWRIVLDVGSEAAKKILLPGP